MQVRLVELLKVQEKRDTTHESLLKHQKIIKDYFDKKTSNPYFKVGSVVLKWDERAAKLGRHSKFESLWTGPIRFVHVNSRIHLSLKQWKANLKRFL